MTKVATDGSPVGLLAAVAIAVPVGALVALPALRLQGLYLALATLAFAVFMDSVFFIRSDVFSDLGSVRVERLEVLGVSFESDRAYFVLLADGVRAVRRGPARPAPRPLRTAVVGAPRQPGRLHDDGHEHDRHEAAGLRAVLGDRRRGRRAARRPPRERGRRRLHDVLEPAARPARRPRWHHRGERRARGGPRPRRAPGAGRGGVRPRGARHPAARDHRRHARPAARRDRALARRCGRRPGPRHARSPRTTRCPTASRSSGCPSPSTRSTSWLSTTHWRSTVPEPARPRRRDAGARPRAAGRPGGLRAHPGAARDRPRRASRHGRRAARTERRRQEHHARRHRRPDPPHRGCRLDGGTRRHRRRSRLAGPRRGLHDPGRARHLPEPHRRREHPHVHPSRRARGGGRGHRVRAVPRPARTPSADGGPPVRRRAADARARPRARHRSGAAAARRAVDGARAA